MDSLICLVFGLLVSSDFSHASFASNDASKTCLDGNCNQKTSLKRQILEEILAKLNSKNWHYSANLNSSKRFIFNSSSLSSNSGNCYSNNSNIYKNSRY